MKLRIIFLLLVICLSSFVVAQVRPPSLDGGQYFFGAMEGAPPGSTLRARVGIREFSTTIENNRYGYTPVLRVDGRNGDVITFVVVGTSGFAGKTVGTATYQQGAVTQLNFNYAMDQAVVNDSVDLVSLVAGEVNQSNQTSVNVPVIPVPPVAPPVTPPVVPPVQPVAPPVAPPAVPPAFPDARPAPVDVPGGLPAQQALPGGQIQSPDAEVSDKKGLMFLIGIIVLMVIVAAVFFYFHTKRKYGPMKDYIDQARSKGYADGSIKQTLVGNGWDPGKVEKYLQ
jgi:hypothetical protein